LRLHPDTGDQNADPARLERVRNAYKLIINNNSNTVERQEDEKDFGVRHVVPQHRQYLEYGGVGSGNPFTRQRQYQQHRVHNALENVREFTVEKTIWESQDPKNVDMIAVEEQKKRQKHRLTGMIDRVVEDMILKSMGAGEFRNLKGAGHPLKIDQNNPYIDQTQQRINRILRDNGFSPPWIVKENELRKSLEDYRQKLCNELAFEIVCLLNETDSGDNSIPTDKFIDDKALNLLANKHFIDTDLKEINRTIQNYNLIAPSMDRQFMSLQRDRELQRAKSKVLNNFPNSKFILEAREKLGREMNKSRVGSGSSRGFLRDLLNRFY